MRYRSFGDRPGAVSALTVRLDDSRHKGSASDWRDFVFAALETGVNSFEIGVTTPSMMAGVGEAFSAIERRLFVVSWRTPLVGGAFETVHRARDLLASLSLPSLDLMTLELEGPLRDPGVLADLRRSGVARLLGVMGPDSLLDEVIPTGDFDTLTLQPDPAGGWNERNRIRAASARGLGIIAIDVEPPGAAAAEEEAAKPGLLRLFTGRGKASPAPAFRIDVPGWTEQQVAVAHTLTEPSFSTVVVQPSGTAALEGLAWSAERELPAGAQAQIEMARIASVPPEMVERRRARR